MNSEKRKKPLRLILFGLCLMALAALTMTIVGRGGDSVTFRVVDAATGLPLTNANAQSYGRWTQLPVEKVRVAKLSPWRTTELEGAEGQFKVAGLPRRSSSSLVRINFYCPGYKPAMFTIVDGGFNLYCLGSGTTRFGRTNLITVALESEDKPLPLKL